MAEYIKREDVLRHRRKMSGADFGGEFWDEAVLCEDIRKIPTADVMEVVRCKDCKRCYEKRTNRNNQLMRFCMRMDGNEYQVNANDFCSYGTLKERGGEK